MKNRRGFLALLAGAVPSAALLTARGNRKGLSEQRQPIVEPKKMVEFDIENSRTVMGAYWNGPLGVQFVVGDPYYETFKDAYWLPASDQFPVNPKRGDCFYHKIKEKVFVWDRFGWFELRQPPGGLYGDLDVGPFRSECGRVTWAYEDMGKPQLRIVITTMPLFLARVAKANLTGAKWHGMQGRKCWSCDLTRENIEYLRQYHGIGGYSLDTKTVFRYDRADDELPDHISGF